MDDPIDDGMLVDDGLCEEDPPVDDPVDVGMLVDEEEEEDPS